MAVTVTEYVDQRGRSPFATWFRRLNPHAGARITTALYRLEQGNFSNTAGVGAGVFESKVDFGPGYRIYFGKDGDDIVILLGGGTKKRQSDDINHAKQCWQDYKRRKRRSEVR